MTIDKLYPVRALINPTNRVEHRAIMQDYDKVAGELTAVERDFYEQLFADNEFTYDELYKFYQERFLKVVEMLERSKKLKTIVINRTYFHDMMYPIERAMA